MKIYYYLIILLIVICIIYNKYKYKPNDKYVSKIEKYIKQKAQINDADIIINNLWLGNYHSSVNKDFLIKNNIKLVINCSRNLDFLDIPETYKFRIDVHDDLSERTNMIIYKNLNYVINLINKYLSKNQGVLVHCRAGMQRSATVIAGYLMKINKLNKEKLIKLIKSNRFIAFSPNANYGGLLSKYEKDLSL